MEWLYFAFGVAAAIEMYFFMMQRVALEYCRSVLLPEGMRFALMPRWYKLAWLAIALKWGITVAIVFYFPWWHALIAVAIPFVISWFIPLPRLYFIRMFDKNAVIDLN